MAECTLERSNIVVNMPSETIWSPANLNVSLYKLLNRRALKIIYLNFIFINAESVRSHANEVQAGISVPN